MCGDLYSFSLYVYTVYIFMPSLVFILFVSRWYSPKEILLNKTFNEYSRHYIENLLRSSSIECYRQSTTLQCRPNQWYRFITWLTHKNNCQLRNHHSLMPSQTKRVLQNIQWERLIYNANSGAKFYVVLKEKNTLTKDNDDSGFVIIL